MKTIVFVGVIFLVACVQANDEARRSKSFTEDFKNLTDSIMASKVKISIFNRLPIKIDALQRIGEEYGIRYETYRSLFNVLNEFRQIYNINPSYRVFKIQDQFEGLFDELNAEKDLDKSELSSPSKINDLVDEFINRNTETLAKLLDNAYIKAVGLESQIAQINVDSSAIIDSFAKNIEKCLNAPIDQFKEVLQCHQNTRAALTPLARIAGIIGTVQREFNQLWNSQFDGKTSFNRLWEDMISEKNNLLGQIQELRYPREVENYRSD